IQRGRDRGPAGHRIAHGSSHLRLRQVEPAPPPVPAELAPAEEPGLKYGQRPRPRLRDALRRPWHPHSQGRSRGVAPLRARSMMRWAHGGALACGLRVSQKPPTAWWIDNIFYVISDDDSDNLP